MATTTTNCPPGTPRCESCVHWRLMHHLNVVREGCSAPGQVVSAIENRLEPTATPLGDWGIVGGRVPKRIPSICTYEPLSDRP